jgi:hypothetical protein
MVRASKNHLAQVDESYFEHLAAALGFAFALAKASVACGLHALIPAFCTHSASRSVAELQRKLVMRAAHARSDGDRVRTDS